MKNKNCLIFSIIFVLINVIGFFVYNYNDVFYMFNNIGIFLLTCVITFAFIILFYFGFIYLFKLIDKIDNKKKNKYKILNFKYTFLIIFIMQLFLYLIAYLAYYPGIFTYDAGTQYMQCINGISSFTQFHPIIHTFILYLSLKIGNVSGINFLTIYVIPQVLFASFTFTYLIKYLYKKNVNKYLILISFIWLVFNPVIRVMNLCMTKDIYFSCLFLLSIIEIIELISNKNYFDSVSNIVKFCILILLTCLFRNNAIYVFVIFGFIYILLNRKDKLSYVVVIPISLYLIITVGLFRLAGFDNTNAAEALSVPMQQVGLVIYNHKNELTNKEIEELQEFFYGNIKTNNYNYRFADVIKSNFKGGNKAKFFKVYFKYLVKYPKDYINAFLNLNIPYWYVGASTIDKYSNREYIETTNYKMNGEKELVRDSKIEWLYNYYEEYANYRSLKNIPVINFIFSISFPFTLTIIVLFSMIYKKRYKYIMILVPYLLLFLTYLAGPVSNFRYIYPFFISYPLLICLMFNSKKILD